MWLGEGNYSLTSKSRAWSLFLFKPGTQAHSCQWLLLYYKSKIQLQQRPYCLKTKKIFTAFLKKNFKFKCSATWELGFLEKAAVMEHRPQGPNTTHLYFSLMLEILQALFISKPIRSTSFLNLDVTCSPRDQRQTGERKKWVRFCKTGGIKALVPLVFFF